MPFNEMLHSLVGQYPSRCQNDKCERPVVTRKYRIRDSSVYSLVIVHESDSVSQEDLRRTLAAVDAEVDVASIYSSEEQPRDHPKSRAILRHINAYALAHYVAFTWSEMAGKWLLRDDSTCKLVGDTLEDVKAKCVANRYLPGLLLYELV